MKLAIVGSRNYPREQYTCFCQHVDSWIAGHQPPSLIVSGGAQGADLLAARYAVEHKIPLKVFRPDWNTHGRAAGPIRNTLIVKECDAVIAFPLGDSVGTWDTVNKGKRCGKEVTVINSTFTYLLAKCSFFTVDQVKKAVLIAIACVQFVHGRVAGCHDVAVSTVHEHEEGTLCPQTTVFAKFQLKLC